VLAAERPEWLVVREGLLSRGATFTGVGAPFRGEADRQAAMSAYEVVAMVDSTKGDQNLVILRRTAPR
jgi:hypothetical protein